MKGDFLGGFVHAGYKACRIFLPGPSDEDRAGELSFGRFALGGSMSMMWSAILRTSFAVLWLGVVFFFFFWWGRGGCEREMCKVRCRRSDAGAQA